MADEHANHNAHWMIKDDEDGLAPHGVVCRCQLGHDHDADDQALTANPIPNQRETGA
jgi:hypothetical protein